jgi:Flp pilus assembly protein TadG
MRYSFEFRRLDRIGCDGHAAAEFALVIPILLVLIVGVFEFGRAYWIQNTLQFAAEQTARCVMANPPSPTTGTTSVTTGTCAISNWLSGLPSTTTTTGNCASVAPPIGTCPSTLGHSQWVAVSYPFQFNTLLAGLVKYVSKTNTSYSSITMRGLSIVPVS